jgi:ABC-type uncharacterized transport system substrate-binding protein
LVNPANPLARSVLDDSQSAAGALGMQFHVLEARNASDFDEAFKAASDVHADAVIIASADPLFGSRAEQLGELALRHRLPAIHQFRRFAVAGGLASYGGDFLNSYRQVGIYTGRILKGEKPADLPVQQSTKLELILNLRTAKTLGLSIPQSLLATADEVIE